MKKSSRVTILEAAAAVCAEVGVRGLTLQAVADRAGMSKGGLLYNFPSKDALLHGMVDQYVEQIGGGTADSTTMTSLQRLLLHRAQCKDDGERQAASSMVAAIAERPELLHPVRRLYSRIWDELKAGDQPGQALVAWLASEGLFLFELFDISPLSPEERAEVMRHIGAAAGLETVAGETETV